MRILIKHPDAAGGGKLIAIWGLGLIGRAIYGALTRNEAFSEEEHVFSWNDAAAQAHAAETIGRSLAEYLAALRAKPWPRVVFIWSAGRAGFTAGSAETDNEMAAFKRVLNLAVALQQRIGGLTVEFHLISSAGGLFEGCKHVADGVLPRPRRPYGQLKLDQEQALLQATPLIPYIYRPASVYGVPGAGMRRSLIPVLLQRGKLRQVIPIIGTPSTLRDYIHVDDLGHYVAAKALNGVDGESRGGLFWMVSGKPASIFEIRGIVEELLRHPLYLAFRFDPDNSCDITFAPQLRLPDFQAMPLRTGISLVNQHWQFHTFSQ